MTYYDGVYKIRKSGDKYIYRGYTISKSGDSYSVRTPPPSSTGWAEIAVNLKIARRWIDADIIECLERERKWAEYLKNKS